MNNIEFEKEFAISESKWEDIEREVRDGSAGRSIISPYQNISVQIEPLYETTYLRGNVSLPQHVALSVILIIVTASISMIDFGSKIGSFLVAISVGLLAAFFGYLISIKLRKNQCRGCHESLQSMKNSGFCDWCSLWLQTINVRDVAMKSLYSNWQEYQKMKDERALK
jgi:hypothetical protein